ncbi:MAG: hypothetical protein MJZ57_03400 [Bacteroidales bacterium]|nr:hypothetical protein [Bacteroidales bacterium]
MKRLTRPLIKNNGQYQEITFEQAFAQIATQNATAPSNSTLVMANGNYSNEELYLIQRLARAGLRTNALGSFDYYRRGTAFFIDKNDIVPFAELFASTQFLLIWDETADTQSAKSIQQILQACDKTPQYVFNTPGALHISNYGAFFRSVNRYLIQYNLAKGIYVDGLGKNYDTYKKQILGEDYSQMLAVNELQLADVQAIVDLLLQSEAPAFIVWERLLDERGVIELENLCMLLNIQAKPASGFLCVKAELNSQGLFDMGFFPHVCVGGLPFAEENTQLMRDLYKKEITLDTVDLPLRLSQCDFKQCLIFNASGTEMPEEIRQQIQNCNFSVLHTSYWNDDHPDFDLILPATLPEETVGTYTDSARIPHNSKPDQTSALTYNNLQQLSELGKLFHLEPLENTTDIFMEYISFFKGGCRSRYRHFFR